MPDRRALEAARVALRREIARAGLLLSVVDDWGGPEALGAAALADRPGACEVAAVLATRPRGLARARSDLARCMS